MASSYSANQYESAFKAQKLQNWNLPKHHKERPSTLDGYTLFIANDRGHLLSEKSKSRTGPWGTYMGTWDMPLKIPPCKLSLASRTPKAANHLTEWICNSTPLISACNGLRPEIDGVEMHPTLKRIPSSVASSSGNQRCTSHSPLKNRYSSEPELEQESESPVQRSPEAPASRQLTPKAKGTCEVPKRTLTTEPRVCKFASPRMEPEAEVPAQGPRLPLRVCHCKKEACKERPD